MTKVAGTHYRSMYMAKKPDRSLYDGLHSATNREWGPDRSNNAYSFGQQGLGGYGDFNGPPRPHRQRAGGFRGRGPRDYVRPDERIADDIIGRLTDDHAVDASQILVGVEGGLVTLTGNVPARRMKHRAEDIAADASGVRDVRNEIRVDDGRASFGAPGEAVRTPNWG